MIPLPNNMIGIFHLRYYNKHYNFNLLAATVMGIYIKAMAEDDDKEVVAQACMGIADITKDFGYATVEPCKHTIYSFLVSLSLVCLFRFSSHQKTY